MRSLPALARHAAPGRRGRPGPLAGGALAAAVGLALPGRLRRQRRQRRLTSSPASGILRVGIVIHDAAGTDGVSGRHAVAS